jgi:hypothetical protein
METSYTLPRQAFELLVEALGDKKKAEIFASAMESAIEAINNNAAKEIVEKKELTKIEIKDELKKELVTREIFEEKFHVIDEKFKSLNFKLNIFIAIALAALTFANPTFVALIGKLF